MRWRRLNSPRKTRGRRKLPNQGHQVIAGDLATRGELHREHGVRTAKEKREEEWYRLSVAEFRVFSRGEYVGNEGTRVVGSTETGIKKTSQGMEVGGEEGVCESKYVGHFVEVCRRKCLKVNADKSKVGWRD